MCTDDMFVSQQEIQEGIQPKEIAEINQVKYQNITIFFDCFGPSDSRWEGHYSRLFGLW
jgi:hypothetical protein